MSRPLPAIFAGTPAGESFDEAVRLLFEADDVALVCHVGPDGDALGSLLAAGIALRSMGKRVVGSWGGDEPLVVPPMYSFLPGLDLLCEPSDFPLDPPLLVTFDTGSVDRLGTLAPVVDKAGAVVMIDHHASNTSFGSVNVLAPSAAATAELVYHLIRGLGVRVDADIAACLYTGLTTDTGSFKFAATSPEVHEIAAELLRTGLRHDLIARQIWDTNRLPYITLLGELLTRTTYEPASRLIWTHVSSTDLAASGVLMEELEGVIDIIRTADEAETAVICKQETDGSYKVSMRSKGAVDVGAICVALGGGGHRYAAGFTSFEDVPSTMARVRAAVDAAPRLTG
ncbi:MAG: bifunctional oligoribonuclease and phosphatase NrnA [Frankiaceae bacterium]|nr:bifunctional oligoribonuclease and phosphatase NrnA [Frankiaceae bacterium]